MGIMSFIFQSNVQDIEFQTLRLNCPYPIIHGNVTNINLDPDGTNITFDVDYANTAFANDVTKFECTQDDITGNLGISTVYYNSTESYFPTFDNAFAWLGHAQMSLVTFFDKIIALATTIYLLVDAPAQATNLSWFTYLNIILVAFIGLGLFMVVRGS